MKNRMHIKLPKAITVAIIGNEPSYFERCKPLMSQTPDIAQMARAADCRWDRYQKSSAGPWFDSECPESEMLLLSSSEKSNQRQP